MGPTLMKEVERTNIVIARPQQQGTEFPSRNPYAMNVDRSKRNYYAYRRFRHMAKHCKNKEMGMNRRMEVEQNNNNLNGNRDLVSPN